MTEVTREPRRLSEDSQHGSTASDLIKSGMHFETHYMYPDQISIIRVPFQNDKMETLIQFKDRDGKERTVIASERFWRSLASKVGFAESIFKLFTQEEVWERIKESRLLTNDDRDSGTDGRLRLVVDTRTNGALALTSADKGYVNYEKYLGMADEHGGEDFRYSDGIITSVHDCTGSCPVLKVVDEDFRPRIYVETPIDGYGHPNVYLGMLREVCVNGIVAMSTAFRTEVNASQRVHDDGTNPIMFTLDRMFETFSNDEGFDALARRLEKARTTPLSLAEASRFMRILQTHRSKFDPEEIQHFEQLMGDFCHAYGIVDPKQLSKKKMAMLPTAATVYDTINFFTEIVTHHTKGTNRNDVRFTRVAQAEIGRMLGNTSGFDLEDTDDESFAGKEYPAFYMNQS